MTGVANISPRQLHNLQRRGREIELIDVRTPAEYRAGHVRGAKLLPLDQLSPETLSEHLQRPGIGREQALYLTCYSGVRAQEAAERLLAAGFHNLKLVEGGTEAWEKANLPMQRCGQVISLERQVQIAIGSLLLLKVLFGYNVHELFFAAAALIGIGLIIAGTTRWCGMARLLARLPWNRQADCPEQTTTIAFNHS